MTGRICFHCDSLTCPGCTPHWLPRWLALVVLALLVGAIALCASGCAGVPQEQYDELQARANATDAALVLERAAHAKVIERWAVQTSELREARRQLAEMRKAIVRWMQGVR